MMHALPTSYWEERGESVINPIGSLARAIDRMSFQDFAWLMIGLANKETVEYALKCASFTKR
jgi:hypothetical protein